MIRHLNLILELLKYAPEVIRVIHSIIKAVEDTQKSIPDKPGEEKKAHAKKILENKKILPVDYNTLDSAIDFGKELLRKNGVI